MKQIVNTEILIAFITLLLISNVYYMFFERSGMLLVLVAGAALVYLSRYLGDKLRGLIIRWLGIIMILFVLLSNPYSLIILFSFIVITALRYVLYKRQPIKVIPMNREDMVVDRLTWFSFQRTPDEVYKFEDLNIQHAVGDLLIDLTKAANLKQENLVIARNLIGKITVVVPHHYQVKINYSTLYGSLIVQDEYEQKALNERLTYESPSYGNDVVIKIFVSTITGDLEVQYR